MLSQVRENLTKAMKARSTVEIGVLRMLMANMQSQEATQGKALTEDQAISVVKKLINQNNEEIAARTGHEQYAEAIAKLNSENAVLEAYLPNFLPAEQIREILTNAENLPQIKSAKNVGAATGVAMKILKSIGKVEGETVKDVVNAVYSE